MTLQIETLMRANWRNFKFTDGSFKPKWSVIGVKAILNFIRGEF